MSEKRSKYALLAIGLGALLIVVAAYGVSNAQCWGGGYHNSGRCGSGSYGGWRYDQVSQNSWLSDDQYKKVRDIRVDYSGRITPLESRLESLRIDLEGYLSDPNADEGKINSLRADISAQEDRIEGLRVEASVKIQKVLTRDQWSNWGCNYDWFDRDWDMHWGSMGNMNYYPSHSMMSSWGCW